MVHMKGFAAIMLIVAAAIALHASAGRGIGPKPAEAAFPGPDNLVVASQECLPTGRVSVTFAWTTYGNGPQWVDLTLFDNGFAPNTFVNIGPLAATSNSVVWDGLLAGRTHYARVNALTSSGWFPTNTLAFLTAPCSSTPSTNFPGADNFHLSSQSCLPTGKVSATLDWISYGRGVQWVDLSLFDNTFGPSSFINMGPIPPDRSDLVWNGLLANRQYFGRVNTLTSSGWVSSDVISFMTSTCASEFSTNSQSVSGNASGPNQAVLTAVRMGAHADEGYDRIVFEFDTALPSATIEYVDNATACGSGMPVTVGGSVVLAVRMTDAAAHTNGQATIGSTRIAGPGGSIIEAVQTCDFEGHVTWAVGTDEMAPFRVISLSDPARIVVDVLR